MEAKTMEPEAYFEQHGEDFDIVMDELADDVSEIVSHFTEIEIEFHESNDNQHTASAF
ncbi:hypothetical protein [Shewanella benthica]|uniref:Uncharacterized protein n=1 Tax=Shewanella benthica KT99 TaxID=314608 RepID=A9EID4_9GAMM|nr:hypothetical protein [Shewanella benthica]EDP99796.1 hypothetical protein KT99_14269 [Shewanella benthica KT99]